MKEIYSIYVENDIIYSGDLSEVPEFHRNKLESALKDWGDVLSKRSLNELIYSIFYWYNTKSYHCNRCSFTSNEYTICDRCGSDMVEKYFYERNENIDKIFDCIGMITSVNITIK